MLLTETVVLADRSFDLPGAGEAGGEGDQVALADLDAGAVGAGDHHLALQEVARLGLVVGPREGGDVLRGGIGAQ